MSRAVIGVVVAAVIAVLTATAYFVTTSSLEGKIRQDVKVRVAKAQELLIQNSSLEMLGLLKRAESLARDPSFVKALGARPDPRQAENAFRRFRAQLAAGEPRPDVMALTDKNGQLVALVSSDKEVVNPVPDTYVRDGKLKYPGLELALNKRQITADVWDYENIGPMRVGVAPVVDVDLDELMGAVVVAYAISATEAREQEKLLGSDVAYFHGERVTASSFGQKSGRQPTEQAQALGGPLFGKGLARSAFESEGGFSDVILVEVGGEEYWASAARMPRFSTQPLPADYPRAAAGAMVMMSLQDAMAPLGTVKLAIILVGLGSILVALLAIFLTARKILAPLDEIELGINDIINGNLERTFRPVGSDLDGLANALNVMLARLLGRPEPGDEEYDDEGNVIRPQALTIDGQAISDKDAEAMALASEPELSYLRRLFDEYTAARINSGEGADGLTYDTFVAKLKANEAQLVAKYKCSTVRFKVITKDGKVTLKPVPLA
jgi:hypothetical protein